MVGVGGLCCHPKLCKVTQLAALSIAVLISVAIVHAQATDAHGGLGYWAVTQLALSVWPVETIAPPAVLAVSEKQIWHAWLDSVPEEERQPRAPLPIPELDIGTHGVQGCSGCRAASGRVAALPRCHASTPHRPRGHTAAPPRRLRRLTLSFRGALCLYRHAARE